MTESLFTMSIAGLAAGFIFSVPVAGPISILVTSNALKGRLRYCKLVTIGASIADFVYVFIAVFGLTKLYSFYKPGIPYILLIGMLFLLYTGYRNFKTKVDLEQMENKQVPEKLKDENKGAFYTGFIINFLNPTLFIGWLTSSFFVISFVASLGLNTGGLDTIINQNVDQINKIETRKVENFKVFSGSQSNPKTEVTAGDTGKKMKNLHLFISLCYAISLSLGSIIWFYLLAILIIKLRKRLNQKIINGIIYGLSIVLCIIALNFGYIAVRMLLNVGQ